jgi:hypothetical protein
LGCGVVRGQARVCAQRVAEGDLLIPARSVGGHHVQVRIAPPVGDLDEETPPGSLVQAGIDDPDRVSIIELRRPMCPPREQHGSSSDRQHHHRWWVGGHWRQQACGPNHADRRPKWIAPYVKGPEGSPLMKDRVHVWRR